MAVLCSNLEKCSLKIGYVPRLKYDLKNIEVECLRLRFKSYAEIINSNPIFIYVK